MDDFQPPSGPPFRRTTSYPSPASSESPLLAGESTQLRAASTALSAAYRRIRQIRRSLDLSNDAMTATAESTNNMGPSHSALLLSASPIEVEDESETEDAGAEFEDRHGFFPWSSDLPSLHPPVPPRLRGGPLPLPPIEPVVPRRLLLETRRRQSSSDDGATLLGRSVAQREAAANMDPVLRAAELERELLQWRALGRRTDPGASAASRADALSRSELIRNARTLDTEPSRQNSTASPNSLSLQYPARRLRTRQNSSTIQSPASASSSQSRRPVPTEGRLSLLSNFSMQNLSTPTSALSRDRPLLFEEPQSYVNLRRNSREVIESPEQRSYLVHRRLNADGDELVHNIDLDNEEDPWTWLGLAPQSNQAPVHMRNARRRLRRHRLTDPEELQEPIPVAHSPEPRRRGWARLDQDGNAIPSDEEEELERERSQYRIRAMYHARASAAAVSDRVERDAQSGVELPDAGAFSNLVTRTSVSPYEPNMRPRVHLGSREQLHEAFPAPRLGYGSVMDSVLAVDNRPPRHGSRPPRPTIRTDVPYGSAVPFVVDPLPIPLSEMMPGGKGKDRMQQLVGIRVSKGAGFAGR
ncbi:hypothetical protein HMN09_00594100 [Mycena chlorophos]|uniref:Uncharacterized protein n=1 Tax=Mycena chlorophos TaxID=658473 RepID=A0A8H6T444_MYCCL|nr:hypothetical protein HMN09_00594100 [Mycena chlorophos]